MTSDCSGAFRAPFARAALLLFGMVLAAGAVLLQAGPLRAEEVKLRHDSRGNVVAIEDVGLTPALRLLRFAPAYGRAGDSVTLVGSGFSATPVSNQVTIGGVAATVTAAAADHLTVSVPANVVSGLVTVTVAAVTATSPQSFTALPATLAVTDIATATEVTADTPAVRVNALANRRALVAFAGQSGDLLSFQFPQLDLPELGSASYQVFSPGGNAIASGTLNGGTRSLHLPPLPASGRYALYLTSSVVLRSQLALESAALIAADGAALNSGTSFRGQSRRLRFTATAQQNLGFALSDRSTAPAGAGVLEPVFYSPDGATVLTTLSNLPQTGTYSVIVKPSSSATQSSFKAWLSNDLSAALALNQQTTAVVTRAGQAYRYTFSGALNQQLRLALQSVTTAPPNQRVAYYLYKPDGSCLEAACYATILSGNEVYTLPLFPVSGSYTLLVDINPLDDGAATFSAPFALSSDVAATLTPDGAATNAATAAPGQYIRASFSGTDGQNLRFAYTDATLSPVGAYVSSITYYRPNGAVITALTNLPETGTYTALLALSPGTTQSGFKLWLSSDSSGTLTAGTPATVAVSRPGQAARYSYAGMAGQSLRLASANTTTAAPAGQRVAITIYKPDGSCLHASCNYNANTGSGGYVDLPLLPVTGNYTFLFDINPYDNANATFSTNITLTLLNP
ncbi:MAG: IPT/TIG domain-containing protein [Rhodanobacteraceae bacterium]|nr:IPT/TIG domain-containing protein [Rhodanobacteraceae bacterium]